MAYEILLTPEFLEDFEKLSTEVARRIRAKIEDLADHPQLLRHPLKHLPESLKGLHKYRIGDYRVLLWPDHTKQQLILYAVAHRREIYRDLT